MHTAATSAMHFAIHESERGREFFILYFYQQRLHL